MNFSDNTRNSFFIQPETFIASKLGTKGKSVYLSSAAFPKNRLKDRKREVSFSASSWPVELPAGWPLGSFFNRVVMTRPKRIPPLTDFP